MNPQLFYTMFQDVFFPKTQATGSRQRSHLALQKVFRFVPVPQLAVRKSPLVIFDFETTGLDYNSDQIIEIGGLKVKNGEILEEFETLVKPTIPIGPQTEKITGITASMLEDKPVIDQVLPEFLSFIEGSVLAAHNADFDMAFLKMAGARLGYQVEWPCFCTLKLARALLPDLDSKSLDNLAAHYNLTFEARHRSIGDCKVTNLVLSKLLSNEGAKLRVWNDLQPFIAGDKK